MDQILAIENILPMAITPILLAPFIGSFIGVLVERLPEKKPVVFSRSVCGNCNSPIKFYDLLPIISWVLLQGKCRQCKQAIGLKHLYYEVGATLIAIWVLLQLPPHLYWIACLLGWSLLGLALTDYNYYVLPNSLNYLVLFSGLFIVFLLDRNSFPDHLIGAICGFLILYLTSTIYTVVRKKEGMGEGDFKLFAAAGAWVSWVGLPSVLLIACCSAALQLLTKSCMGTKVSANEKIPLGSHLCLGIWLVWLYGPLHFTG